jgi:hypothetical protein
VNGWELVLVSGLVSGDDAVSLERPYPEVSFWDASLRIVTVQIDVLGGLVQEVGAGRECPFLVS